MSLAYEGPRSPHTDAFTVEAFYTALDDSDFADKIRELQPVDLDEAVRHAKRIESYGQSRKASLVEDVPRNRRDKDHGHVRAVVSDSTPVKTVTPVVTTAVVKDQIDMNEIQRLHMEINYLKEAARQKELNSYNPQM